MTGPFVVKSKAVGLREAFDLSFALPAQPASQPLEDLLTIRVGGDPYAIRLREIAGIVAGRRVVAVPAFAPDLLGLAGIRGGIVSVFGLGSLLGYGQGLESPRWMILCGSEDAIALAFSDFEGYVRIAKSAVHGGDELGARRQYVDQVAVTEGGARPIISIALVVATIRNRIGHNRLATE